jgi:hypothetical protein
MTPSKMWLLPATVAALTLGHTGSDLKPADEKLPLPTQYIVLAADEPQGESDTDASQVQSEESADGMLRAFIPLPR